MADSLHLFRDIATMPVGERRWETETLVPFSPDLAPQAHALLLECYSSGAGGVPQQFDAWWAQTRHDPEFDAELCFCVTHEGHLVGFELCWSSGFIKDLGVKPGFRRRGIGEALLRRALAAFKARGLRQVSLKVRPDNMAARRLYARVGFRKD